MTKKDHDAIHKKVHNKLGCYNCHFADKKLLDKGCCCKQGGCRTYLEDGSCGERVIRGSEDVINEDEFIDDWEWGDVPYDDDDDSEEDV